MKDDQRPVLTVVRDAAEVADAVALEAAQSGRYDHGTWLVVRDGRVVDAISDYKTALARIRDQGGTLHMVGLHDPGTVNLNEHVRPESGNRRR